MADPATIHEPASADLLQEIAELRRELGPRVTILGHHYQRDEVIRFADHRGDSLELSRRAAGETRAEYIVFCGVFFMAETAAILAGGERVVVQPVIEALCPMARLANGADAAEAWEALNGLWPGGVTPVTYQNSTAEVKAFVGRHGGSVCTSSNAEAVLRWAWAQTEHVLFMPDEHLATNTGLAMGLERDDIGVWDYVTPPNPAALRACRLVAWKGHCYVHTTFRAEDVQRARERYPDALVVVHPECPHEVVALADRSGSTTAIIAAVREAPAGSTIVVGTEWHLVNRLAQEHPDKRVLPLRRVGCKSMAQTGPQDLREALRAIAAGQPINVVTVPEDTAHWARLALERMLQAS